MTKRRKSTSKKTSKQHSSPRTIKLTENQQLVLIKASQRDDGELIERFDGAVIGSGAADGGFGSSGNDHRMIQGFLNKGLVEGDPDDPSTLRLTALAFAALNIDESEWPKRLRDGVASACSPPIVTTDEKPALQQTGLTLRDGSKGARVLALLRRKSGATLDQLEAATEWQTHSVRGFLSGTVRKKLGLELRSSKRDNGQRVYRVSTEA